MSVIITKSSTKIQAKSSKTFLIQTDHTFLFQGVKRNYKQHFGRHFNFKIRQKTAFLDELLGRQGDPLPTFGPAGPHKMRVGRSGLRLGVQSGGTFEAGVHLLQGR